MKYLSRILVFAFAIISAAACYNNEIEDSENPQAPERSGLRITATMAKTRVSYGNENDYELLPVWEKGDILFGFYVESDEIKNFILKVTDVDGSYGATLGFVAGKENGLADQPVATRVYLIYTGKNGESSIDLSTDAFSAAGEFSVDLTSQYLERVPVCMSATASIAGTADAKTLSFSFDYDCAILEINSLTGFGEEGFTSGTLSSIEVTDVIQQGTYSLDNNSLVFSKAAAASAATYEIDFSESAVTGGKTWRIDENGIIVNNDGKEGVLIAAVPGEAKSKLTVTGKTTVGADSHDFSFDYGSYRLEKGNCYVIGAKDVVSKTADGKYFKTVTAAFAHADTLYQDSKANTVTLLRDCGLAGIDATGVPVVGTSAPIEIDGYNVTLDLNGKTLELKGDDECFCVAGEDDSFTIKDSSTGNSGAIISSEAYDSGIVNNSGYVTIEGGILVAGYYVAVNEGALYINDGTLKVEYAGGSAVVLNNGYLQITGGGELYSSSCEVICNEEANTIIMGGTVHSDYGRCINNTDGDVTISGGEIRAGSDKGSNDNSAIYCTGYDAELKISGGSITSDYGYAIEAEEVWSEVLGGTITSTNGVAINVSAGGFSMVDGTVSGKGGGIRIIDGCEGDISDGTIECEDGYALCVENSKCTLSGGKIINESTTKSAVYCFTDESHAASYANLSIQWYDPDDETKGGPLIVSSSEAFGGGKSYGAVSTANPIDEKTHEEITNYAIVEISGGYLSSSDDAFCSIAGNSSLLLSGAFYTDKGKNTIGTPVKSPYYDFSKGAYEYVPSEIDPKTYGGYPFGFKISATWTYVIENCSQTKTEIGADEAVTYSFRSYKQKGTEKVAVPWIAQMCVAGDGNVWHDNHSYGPDGNGWYWTTSRDDGVGGADRGIGSVDSNEDYTITFKSTKSDTYSVKIIASDAAGSTSYTFAPVVQTISSSPSTDPTITELWHGSTTEVSISSTNFNNASPRSGCMLRVYAEVNQQNNPINTITCTLVAGANGDIQQQEKFTDDGFVEFEIAETLYDVICSYGCKFVIYYGANITKVELIQ